VSVADLLSALQVLRADGDAGNKRLEVARPDVRYRDRNAYGTDGDGENPPSTSGVTRECKKCTATESAISSGERSAEMTCRNCLGGGVERFVAPKNSQKRGVVNEARSVFGDRSLRRVRRPRNHGFTIEGDAETATTASAPAGFELP